MKPAVSLPETLNPDSPRMIRHRLLSSKAMPRCANEGVTLDAAFWKALLFWGGLAWLAGEALTRLLC